MSEVKVSIIRRGAGQSAKQQSVVINNPATPVRVNANVQSGNSVIGMVGNNGNYAVIAIGASAGGPQAVQSILNLLPSSLPVPVLIVQHIDSNFAEGYCEWLGSTSKLPVHVASDGEVMVAGHVYLPPGDHHLGLQKQGVVSVNKSPPERGLRPAVSFLFRDIMSVYGKNAIAIILSGMGSDGAAEIKKLRDLGAYTFAQDAGSSLVHGMPGEAIKLGGASRILPPDEIAKEIIEIFQLR
jgi:two-component system, chemotaxis family, protein-glutamate methylesterase/glutaminase